MILIVDTETTGLPNDYKAPSRDIDNWPRPIEIAWVLADPDTLEVIKEVDRIIKLPDDFKLDPKITELTGITLEMINEEGVDLEEALAEFEADVASATAIVAHNLNFDRKIIKSAWYRLNTGDAECGLFPMEIKQVCTMLKATPVCKIPKKKGFGIKWPSLSEAHKHFMGSDFEGAHRALNDVLAAKNIFQSLKALDLV